MKLYVIRHGQTDCNLNEKYNCRFDEDINETGIEQAEKASEKVGKIDLDLIICSPMKRTRHTCELVNVNKVPVIYDDRLMERIGGVLTNAPIEKEYYENEFYNYYSKNIPDGLETLPELFTRIHGFLDEIKVKYADKNILLVTHGAVSRSIEFYSKELPKDGNIINLSGQENCEVKEYKI